MFKTQVLVRRKPGVEREAFENYWLNRHAAIAADVRGIKRETVSIVRADLQRADSPWDGLVNTWWDGFDLAASAKSSEAYKSLVAAEQDLMDLSFSDSLVVCEVNPTPQSQPPIGDPSLIKIVNPLRKREDLTMEEFCAYWRGPHAVLSKAMPHMIAYIQNHVHRDLHALPRSCYGIAESWFNSWEEVLAVTRSDAYARVKDDEPNLLAPGSLFPMICREYETIELQAA